MSLNDFRNKKPVHLFMESKCFLDNFKGSGYRYKSVKAAHGTPSAVSEAHTGCSSEPVSRAPRAPAWGDGAEGRKGLSVEVRAAGVSEAVEATMLVQ